MDFRYWITASLVTAALVFGSAPASAAWPGQNGRIAFTRDPGEKVTDLWSVRSTGADEQQLTDAPSYEFDPAQSPTSRTIVYSAFVNDSSYDICRLTNAGDCDQLTDSIPGDRYPAFSPDGEKIVWEREGEIYKMNADGSGKRRLVDLTGTEHQPVWSPNGERIAFHRQLPSGQSEIFTMKPNGDAIRRITRSSVDDYSCDWHPTKNALVWTQENPSDIFDTNIVKKSLAPGSSLHVVAGSPRSELDPAYSPNGKKIAYTRFSVATDSDDIYVMNANGSEKHVIVDSPGREFHTYWLLAAD